MPRLNNFGDPKGWGLSAKLGRHSAIWGKLGTALQAYALNRPQRSIETIASFDQWSGTIENH